MSASKQLEDAVFFAALHLTDSEQRRVFLDQACAGNLAMRSVIEELLAAQEETERVLNRGRSALESAIQEFPALAATAVAPAPPRPMNGLARALTATSFCSDWEKAVAAWCIWRNKKPRCAGRSRSKSSSWAWTRNR